MKNVKVKFTFWLSGNKKVRKFFTLRSFSNLFDYFLVLDLVLELVLVLILELVLSPISASIPLMNGMNRAKKVIR